VSLLIIKRTNLAQHFSIFYFGYNECHHIKNNKQINKKYQPQWMLENCTGHAQEDNSVTWALQEGFKIGW
jgi:hypothetical protein